MDLTSAVRLFREKRRIADELYLSLIAAREAVDDARTEFELKAALAVERRIALEYEAANTEAKEARRRHGRIMAGLGVTG